MKSESPHGSRSAPHITAADEKLVRRPPAPLTILVNVQIEEGEKGVEKYEKMHRRDIKIVKVLKYVAPAIFLAAVVLVAVGIIAGAK